jgi:hypothetical protein
MALEGSNCGRATEDGKDPSSASDWPWLVHFQACLWALARLPVVCDVHHLHLECELQDVPMDGMTLADFRN